LFTINSLGQSTLTIDKPEKQISFARENKPHSYYVRQAELWWNEIKKDSTSETNWYNYYRACRSAQGTYDWKEDFVKESPALRTGGDIVTLMAKFIPNTFTYYYAAGSTGGVDPSSGKYLIKAYEMNPEFEGIHASVVTYAQSIFDTALRKSANKIWFKKNELSPGLIAYGYNVLMSVDPDAVLLTQHDNDSYPVWMLQDVSAVRTGILVINIDFLILDSYRDKVFKDLDLPPLDLSRHNINDYRDNWKTIVHHILNHYKNKRSLYVGLTLFPELYQDFSNKLFVSGLALRYSNVPINLSARNRQICESLFLLDYLKIGFVDDNNQSSVDAQNLNYLKCFKIVYDHYKTNKNIDKAKKIKVLSLLVGSKTENREFIDKLKLDFK
ncbi:MAG TPA: hypothetical protein VFH08_03380, partial [Chitinophagaceae bacterium]|nr:hypothetical protein [Chitinophagaceae bacterium]